MANKNIFFENFLVLMRLICIIFVLLFVIVISAQCQQTAEDWFTKGNDLLDKGSYDLAIMCYNNSIELNPDFAAAWNNKCSALYRQNKFDEAVRACDEAIRLDLNLSAAWHGKGIALLRSQDKFDEAIKAFDEAIRLDPNLAPAWAGKGTSLVSKAIKAYDEDNTSIGSALAGEALEAYDEATRLDPNDVQAWSGKYLAFTLLNRTTEADAALAKARDLGFEGSAISSTTSSTTTSSSTTSSDYSSYSSDCDPVYVEGYYRRDGTYVRPHYRSHPGCG